MVSLGMVLSEGMMDVYETMSLGRISVKPVTNQPYRSSPGRGEADNRFSPQAARSEMLWGTERKKERNKETR